MNSAPPTGNPPGGSRPPSPLPGQPFDPNASAPPPKLPTWVLATGLTVLFLFLVVGVQVTKGRRRPAVVGPFPAATLAPEVVQAEPTPILPNQPAAVPPATSAVAKASVKVHVSGAVRAPGVYDLAPNSRVQDAVSMAGGPLPEADANALNLAAFVKDGGKIVVPMKGAAPLPDASGSSSTVTGIVSVNINTADQAELETLPQVGPKMAQQIIAFRQQNGPFQTVEDLGNVPGIGLKTLAQLEPYVRVN